MRRRPHRRAFSMRGNPWLYAGPEEGTEDRWTGVEVRKEHPEEKELQATEQKNEDHSPVWSGRLHASYRTGPQTAPAYARHACQRTTYKIGAQRMDRKSSPITTPEGIKPSSKRGAQASPEKVWRMGYRIVGLGPEAKYTPHGTLGRHGCFCHGGTRDGSARAARVFS